MIIVSVRNMDISPWPTVAPAISTVAAAFLTVTTAIYKRGTGIYDLAPASLNGQLHSSCPDAIMQLPRRDYGCIKPCAIWWILDAIHRVSIRVRINVRVRIRIRVRVKIRAG